MKDLDALLEEYISADEDRRLSMFLSCRGLRNRFMEIDLSESTLAAVSPPVDVKGTAVKWLAPVLPTMALAVLLGQVTGRFSESRFGRIDTPKQVG